jgi:hypothetical protein
VLWAHITAEVCVTSPDATPFGKVNICPLAGEGANAAINSQIKDKTAGLYFKFLIVFLILQVPQYFAIYSYLCRKVLR